MRNAVIRDLFPEFAVKDPSGGSNDGKVPSMMLAVDDPLRDTPEKAERYAKMVHAMSGEQRALTTEADVAAALKLLAPRG